MSILKFLGLEDKASPSARVVAETETVRAIAAELDGLEPGKARYIAKFAYILSRVASVDLRVSPEETLAMERIVVDVGGLDRDQACLAVRLAKARNLIFGGTDNFLVTREFNRIATDEQKLALLDCLFAVSAAEGFITAVEDNEIRQVSSELQLDHRAYIAVRLNYRDRLAVFQDLPRVAADPPLED